jgi:hypothetical protein
LHILYYKLYGKRVLADRHFRDISAHVTEVADGLEEPVGRPLRQPVHFQRVRSEDVVDLLATGRSGQASLETHDLIILTLRHR